LRQYNARLIFVQQHRPNFRTPMILCVEINFPVQVQSDAHTV